MRKKEMIAMLLAGGQGSRLGVLTAKVAKPAVAFGGKYRIIDFPLSNCINSGIDTVGVLTQYQPLRLNTHIGIGIPWDLDRNFGGVTILPPYEKSSSSEWYTGTANAIYQNLDYMETFNPDYVLILSGDHIYKMDYEVMLDYHKENQADVTIAAMPVPKEEASRFGIVVTDDEGKIAEFQEKPPKPKTSLGSKLREGKLLADIFVPIALEAAKGFFYKLQIDVLELYIHVGAYDPADGAVLYGRANALAAAVWLPLNQAFRIREGRVRVDWDPLAEKLVCAGQLALSLRIGEILWIGLRFGLKALAGFLRYRRLKRKAV